MRKGSFEESGGTDGVDFSVFQIGNSTNKKLLYNFKLRPSQNPSHRGRKYFDLEVPKNCKILEFEFSVGDFSDSSWDWSYISNVNFHSSN